MGHRKKYLIYYNNISDEEKKFINQLLNLIIKYPIIWNNYIENIVTKKYVVKSEKKIIINYPLIDDKNKEIIILIYQYLKENHIIEKEIEKSEFVILYLNSEFVSLFISDRNYWIKFLIAKICLEYTSIVYLDCKIKFEDNKIIESDVVMKKDKYLFIINNYEKHHQINSNLDHSRYIITIYYKPKNVKTLIRRNLINYSFDYQTFKNEFENIVMKKITDKTIEK